MANVRASGSRVLTNVVIEGSCERQVESNTSKVIGEVVLEGSHGKDLSFVDDDRKVIPACKLTVCFSIDSNPTGHILEEVVIKGPVERERGLVHRWRFTEIDPVIVSDVGVGNGLTDANSAGGNNATASKSTGAAGEHVSLERVSQYYTDPGRSLGNS
jgi:hypothetical protein